MQVMSLLFKVFQCIDLRFSVQEFIIFYELGYMSQNNGTKVTLYNE